MCLTRSHYPAPENLQFACKPERVEDLAPLSRSSHHNGFITPLQLSPTFLNSAPRDTNPLRCTLGLQRLNFLAQVTRSSSNLTLLPRHRTKLLPPSSLRPAVEAIGGRDYAIAVASFISSSPESSLNGELLGASLSHEPPRATVKHRTSPLLRCQLAVVTGIRSLRRSRRDRDEREHQW